MWQCSCGKGCRTALECLSNVKPKKALALDKELESNIKSNVRQSRSESRSESRGFGRSETGPGQRGRGGMCPGG